MELGAVGLHEAAVGALVAPARRREQLSLPRRWAVRVGLIRPAA